MNFNGILVGAVTFLLIGLFHPIVVKAEYYFSKNCWWFFLLLGLGALAASLLVKDLVVSVLLGVLGITCLWTIKELFEQEKRVEKGWSPANPRRAKTNKKP